MNDIEPGLLACYQRLVQMVSTAPIYYRHRFCQTKNKSTYLKIVTRKGTFFSPSDLNYLEGVLRSLAPAIGYSLNTNHLRGTVSIKLYYTEGV